MEVDDAAAVTRTAGAFAEECVVAVTGIDGDLQVFAIQAGAGRPGAATGPDMVAGIVLGGILEIVLRSERLDDDAIATELELDRAIDTSARERRFRGADTDVMAFRNDMGEAVVRDAVGIDGDQLNIGAIVPSQPRVARVTNTRAGPDAGIRHRRHLRRDDAGDPDVIDPPAIVLR